MWRFWVGGDPEGVLRNYRRVVGNLQRLVASFDQTRWRDTFGLATSTLPSILCPSGAARYNIGLAAAQGGCTPNTRVNVIDRIIRWADDPDTASVYWLNGMAGTGKTTIAYSVCTQLDANAKLAASFFCSRSLPGCRNVSQIMTTVAYQLAEFSHPYFCTLSRILDENPGILCNSIQIQFDQLIVRPLVLVQETMPDGLVIVIDALDECEDRDGTSQVLRALLAKTAHLPIKFIVSSRPEPEITDSMARRRGRRARLQVVLHELDRGEVQADIQTYLRAALALARPNNEQILALVERSGGVFIYAATITRYVMAETGTNAGERLLTILGMSTVNMGKPVDRLYDQVLTLALEDYKLDESRKDDIKQLLAVVTCAKEPLTVTAISRLLGMNSTQQAINALNRISSVIHIVQANMLVSMLHASFSDYMLDPMRSGRFHCHPSVHHVLALRCFTVIKEAPRQFNICELESSYLLDDQVPDLPKRVKKAISQELHYACINWALHLEHVWDPAGLVDGIVDFLSNRLLLWMEVLNLKKCNHIGPRNLGLASQWLKNRVPSKTVQLAEDALEFAKNWSSELKTPYKGGSSSVSYSPTGGYVVSGSNDAIIRTWDTRSGRLVKEFTGHTGAITSVGYSPNGECIVSGAEDGTVRVWDTKTGELMLTLLNGRSVASTSVATSVTYSSDGRYVASGSEYSVMRIWDLKTGLQVSAFDSLDHTRGVTSISYSPDGAHILTFAPPKTAQILNAQTGKLERCLSVAPNQFLRSVAIAFSPDCTRIASGSADGYIYVSDVQTGELVTSPFMGGVGPVLSIAYSPSGTQIAWSPNDRTLRLWNLQTGELEIGPFQHNQQVTSLAYSPDGGFIVSGSNRGVMHFWDARNKRQKNHVNFFRVTSSDQFSSSGANQSYLTFSINEDGWVVDDSSRLIIWIPPGLRGLLNLQNQVLKIPNKGLIRFDWDNAFIGEKWMHCYHPN
ncbi:hypothetical protein OPQ81_011813 [Rhizoctonia solani]|nr:hypothetical protein OPQ81_011813 [Rhizoctonia solani]